LFGFAVLADPHLGRNSLIVNWWDRYIPQSDKEVVGESIAERLKKFVRVVNSEKDVRLVVSVGDNTESISPSQTQLLKEIMSGLNVPWLPIPGNHDMWPYERDFSGQILWEAKEVLQFSSFKKIFNEEFEKLTDRVGDWQEQNGRLANFSFICGNIQFIAIDNVNRQKASLKLPGVKSRKSAHPQSQQWLFKQLEETRKRKVIIISHAPMRLSLPNGLKRGKHEILMLSGHKHRYLFNKNGKISSLTAGALYLDPIFPIIKEFEENGFDIGMKNF